MRDGQAHLLLAESSAAVAPGGSGVSTGAARSHVPLKGRFHGPDTAFMSKKGLMLLLGLAAFAFTYIAAVNVKEFRTYPSFGGGTYVSSSCKGMWDPTEWFGRSCEDSLPPRLGVLALGFAILLVCLYFGDKEKPLVGGHAVTRRPNGGWGCMEEDCDFWSNDRGPARAHRIQTGAVPAASASFGSSVGKVQSVPNHAVGFDTAPPATPVQPHESPSRAIAEWKTCPDCAEDVRAAARKCRFCGYQFEAREAG
jgi:hypothetical protein